VGDPPESVTSMTMSFNAVIHQPHCHPALELNMK
jgi:hypothetical protein